jgi:phage minor structural protein
LLQDIYILDPNERLKVTLSNDGSKACPILDDGHVEKLNNAFSTYTIVIPGDHEDSARIEKKDKILRQDVEGNFILFTIEKIKKGRDTSGNPTLHITGENAGLELLGKIVRPGRLQGYTPAQALEYGLESTRFEAGAVDWATTETFDIKKHLTGVDYVHTIASRFDGEIKFRVEFNQTVGKITRRFVDMLQRRGSDKNVVVEYGKNLSSLWNESSSQEIVTAIIPVGPNDENGNPLTITALDRPDSPLGQDWIGDDVAREKWGIPQPDGSRQHFFGVYTYSGDNEELDAQTLYEYGKRILKGNVEPRDSWEVKHTDLARQEDFEDDELIILGDGVLVRDFDLNPEIVLNARAVEIKRSYINPENNDYVFGSYLQSFTASEGSRLRELEETISRNRKQWGEKGITEVTDGDFPDIVPAQPVVEASGAFQNVFVEWEYLPASYIAKYEVYGSETSGFSASAANLLYEGKNGAFTHEAGTDKTFYYKVRGVNTRGNAGPFSAEVSASTVKILTEDMLFGSVNKDIIADLAVEAEKLADLSVNGEKLVDGAVISQKIANLAVEAAKIASGAVNNAKLASLAVDAAKLASGAVLEGKLGDLAVTAAKLAEGSVLTGKIALGAVNNPALANLAVDAAKLAEGSVEGPKIANSAVDNAKLDDLAVTAGKMADGSVINAKLANLAVDANKIAAGAVNNSKLQDLAVDAAKLASGSVTNAKIGLAAISNGQLQDLIVDAGKLASGSVTNAKIGPAAVNTAELKDAAVLNGKLANLAVSAAKLADGAATEAKIGLGAITNTKLAGLVVDAAKLADGAATEAKIGPAAITNAKLGSLAVTAAKLASGAVGSGQLASDAVTRAKIAAGEVINAALANGAINNAKLADLSVDAAKLADSSVTAQKIANLAVGTAAIQDAAITNAKVQRLSADKITIGGSSVFENGYDPTKMEWGGRNLLTNTTDETKNRTFSGWDSYLETVLLSKYGLKAGENLTGRIYLKPTNEDAKVHLDFRNNSGSSYRQYFGNTISAGSEGYSVVTVEIPSTAPNGEPIEQVRFSIRHNSGETPTDSVDYKEPKLEKGTQASDWSPSPEDTKNDIETAKNYTTELWAYPETSYFDGGNIYTNSVTANKMAVGTITAASGVLADAVITSAKIGSLAVGSAALQDLAVTNAKIGSAAVDSAKIKDLAVGTAAIANAAVNSAKILNLAVGTASIADAAINSAKILNLAVGSAALADAAITNAKIQNLAVSGAKIANLTVGSGQLADASITNAKILNLAVDNGKIANAAITSAKINNLAVGNAAIQDAAITNAKMGSLSVGTAELKDLAVTNAKIANLAVGTAAIQDAAITNAKIDELSADKIKAGFLSTERLYMAGKLITISDNKPVTYTGGSLRDGGPVAKRNTVGAPGLWIGTEGQSFTVDLKTEIRYIREISFATYYAEDTRFMPKGYKIQSSLDNAAWSDRVVITNNANMRPVHEVDFHARYIRFVITQKANNATSTGEQNIALFEVKSAQAGAAEIHGDVFVSGTVSADKMATNSITATNGAIANLAVENSKIKDLAVTNAKIGSLAVDTAQLADAAITTAKIENLAVGNAAIANGAINNAKIGSLAVDTAEIQDGAIERAKIGSLAVGTAAIDSLAVTEGKIANLAVGTAAIQDLAVTNAKLEQIRASKIAVGDFTNLFQYDVENNPGTATAQVGNNKYFKTGSGNYAKLDLFNTPKLEFKVGDEYIFSGSGWRDSGVSSSVSFIVRYYYTDGSWTNAGRSTLGLNTSNSGYSCTVKIDTAIDETKSLKNINVFLEAGNPSSGYFYMRNIEVRKRYTGKLIVDGTITATEMAANSITAANAAIANLAVEKAKIANLAVGNAAIDNLSVSNGKIGNLAVDTAQIDNGAITNAKIGYLAVDAAKIANLSVDTAHIKDLAITSAKVSSISADKITAGTITGLVINAGKFNSTGNDGNIRMENDYFISEKYFGSDRDYTEIRSGAVTSVIADYQSTFLSGNGLVMHQLDTTVPESGQLGLHSFYEGNSIVSALSLSHQREINIEAKGRLRLKAGNYNYIHMYNSPSGDTQFIAPQGSSGQYNMFTMYYQPTDYNHSVLYGGQIRLKFLASKDTLQIRNNNDTAYGDLNVDTITYSSMGTWSDRRLKENIEPADSMDAWEVLRQIKIKTFNYKGKSKKVIGAIHDEAPAAIRVDGDPDIPETNGIDTGALTWINTKAIKDLVKVLYKKGIITKEDLKAL